MKDKLRMLLLIDTISGPNGGTEKHVLDLINHLDRSRFEVYLGCLFQSNWLSKNPPDCTQFTLNFKGYWHPMFIRQLLKLIRFLRREKIRLLYGFFPEANLIGALTARLGGVPYFMVARRNIGHRNTPIRGAILRLLRPMTDIYVANCQAVKLSVMEQERVPETKIRVVYNGVDASKFKPNHGKARVGLPEDRLIVGMVANLKKIKGIDYLLQAAKIMANKRTEVSFIIIGGEYEERRYLNLRDEMKLEDRCSFLGIKEEIVDYLNAFDVAVNASLVEGFSNSILEYMACGLPVVATEVGGSAEAVVDGQTGLLVPAADSESLAAAMEKLLDEQSLRRQMGEKGRQRVIQNFTREKMIQELQNLFLELPNAS
jgi:glycosyltransferase involved in cell wall biosynthesis